VAAARREEIIGWCDELLDAPGWDDYAPNGLQVPGAAEVTKVATGVSAHRELLERAVAAGAELVLAHHGLFWGSQPLALSDQMAERLRIALGADLSVAAYHLPLDAHREIGNNALLCRELGFEPDPQPFAEVRGRPIGMIGRSLDGFEMPELVARVTAVTDRDPLVFDAGPPTVRSIGIVSGGASSQIADAVAAGLDAFMTGEPSEHAMADAREGGINFIAAGHHATERVGIRRLGELVAEHFGIDHQFIDVPNPI
jgi:dinuclear metal center YbgI/SA1388 family protein